MDDVVTMCHIQDAAAHILSECGVMPTMKLHKLAYYAQALSLAQRDMPLFPERFQAWRTGPVCVDLFSAHRGLFLIRPGNLPTPVLNAAEVAVIDRVCATLGHLTGNQLTRLVMREQAWLDARQGCRSCENTSTLISVEAMREHEWSPVRA